MAPRLSSLERVEVEDGDLRLLPLLGALGDGDVLVVGADRDGSDALRVFGGRDELLRLLLRVENQNVVPTRVEHRLLVKVTNVVLHVRLEAEAVARGD